MGTHLRVLSEGFPMSTNMSLDGFRKSLHSCALDKSSLSIGRVNPYLSLPDNFEHNLSNRVKAEKRLKIFERGEIGSNNNNDLQSNITQGTTLLFRYFHLCQAQYALQL